MADIKNKEDLEKWLEGKPESLWHAVATRCALRVLPYTVEYFDNIPDKNLKPRGVANYIILPAFRALASAFTGMIIFDQSDTLQKSIEISGNRALKAVEKYKDSPAAFSVLAAARAAHSASSLKFNDAIDFARNSYGYSVAANIATNVNLYAIWNSIGSDCTGYENTLERFFEPYFPLIEEKLWAEDLPVWFGDHLMTLKHDLLSIGDDWDVWTRWFDDRVNGVKADEVLETRRVSIPEEDWDKGAAHVNALIRKMEEERAAELAAEKIDDTELPPVPDSGPGAELQPTPSGFEIVSTPVDMDEAALVIQKSLHNSLLRRVRRLDSEIVRICNTHRSLRDEYDDYATFIRVPFNEIDVTSIWSVGAALNDMVMRLERQFERAQTSTKATDIDELPDEAILSQLTSLMRDHSGFIMGYNEALALNAKVAKLRQLEISPQILGEQAGAVLKPMLQTKGLLAKNATRVVASIDRALEEADEKTTALVIAGTVTATKYVVSFGRALVIIGALGSGVTFLSTLAGDPNLEAIKAVLRFLHENQNAISAFGTHDSVFMRWFSHLIDRSKLAIDEEAVAKKK